MVIKRFPFAKQNISKRKDVLLLKGRLLASRVIAMLRSDSSRAIGKIRDLTGLLILECG